MQTAMARGKVGAFSRRLEELKEAGSLLLVVGDDPRARSAVSEQLLGSPRAERLPVFVLLGRDRAMADERVGDADLDPSQVIEYAFSRSVAQSGGETTASSRRQLTSLGALADDIDDTIEAVAARTEAPLAAGQLRVCIDSLTGAVDGFERAAVEGFLDEVRDAVTDRRGMAHAVLPLPAVPDRYSWLAGEFDAVVEARSVEGDAQERWRLADGDLLTEWFPVDAAEVG